MSSTACSITAVRILKSTNKNDAEKLAELRSDQALEQIRQVIDDDTLSDPQCFAKNKRIICRLEKAGSNGGARHDFG